MKKCGGLVGAATLLLSSLSLAQPADPGSQEQAPAQPVTVTEPPDQPAPYPAQERWYGWQTLTVDGAVLALGVLPLTVQDKATNNVLGAAWFGTYALGAPIVHWAHGHVGKGFGSLGMRVGGPIAGALLGAGIGLATGADFGTTDTNGNRLYVSTGDRLIASGAILGMLAPIVIDAAVLAREPARQVGTAGRGADTAGLHLTGGPILLRGGAGFSAGGTF